MHNCGLLAPIALKNLDGIFMIQSYSLPDPYIFSFRSTCIEANLSELHIKLVTVRDQTQLLSATSK